ncbi:hypothetical protein P3W43_01265 [Salinicola salarius]|uniref:hypothetical protein n=1 Tax=Salinicola salarius TaxID=430457 RepID=UPI0023E3C6ED|nr:hypothetical protein [Salinicola salarius]MDF3917478.1 hypothetical protein [Salinicola salarius]
MNTTTTYTNQFAPAIAGVFHPDGGSTAIQGKDLGELFDGCMSHARMHKQSGRSIEGGMHLAVARKYSAASAAVSEIDALFERWGRKA